MFLVKKSIRRILLLQKLTKLTNSNKHVGRKFSRGGEANEKKDRKIAKKAKKIALLASIYYICTMFENPGGATASLIPAADAHVQQLLWDQISYIVSVSHLNTRQRVD